MFENNPAQHSDSLRVSAVIATRNRPEPLCETLKSLNLQLTLPLEVVVVDSSDNTLTQSAVEDLRVDLKFAVFYERCAVPSSARQRNIGAQMTTAEIISFLDDDLDLEPGFLMEVVRVFETDRTGSIGGVTGAIRNQPYSEPKGLNRFLLAPGIGAIRGTFAGRLMGPAINFLPAANEESVQEVEWLPSCCVAYRREAFLKEQFPDTFEGYSFAEDVHLSSRVAKSYRVVCAGKARVFHHDLGKNTHKDWKALGKSMVLNRYAVMTDVLQRRSLRYFLQLAYFELFYTSATWIAAGLRKERLLMLNNLLSGKLAAFSEILRIRSHGRSIA